MLKVKSFAIVAPGLESLARAELDGLRIRTGKPVAGGLEFDATLRQLYEANLHLRTVSRVVARIARFRATAFWELQKQARKVPWERWVGPGASVSFSVTAHKSRLYHQRAIAERLFEAVTARAGSVVGRWDGGTVGRSDEGEREDEVQRFLVRLDHDQVVISADTSGALLHRRGYRLATARAPLRETLAAAMLSGAGWAGSVPLLDPFCGSGTIPIEAARLALHIPPGWQRRFAFERWPGFEAGLWASVREAAGHRIRSDAIAPIQASDRDAGAVAAARANAERAGVLQAIDFRHLPLSGIEPGAGAGWLITNPPYGVRVGSPDRLRNLYARLGQIIQRMPGWSAGLLVSDRRLAGHTGLPLREVWKSRTGDIPVAFLVAEEGFRRETIR